MFFDAGGDREDVGIEDDILGREVNDFRQDFVGAGAHIDPALIGVGLSVLVESHDHAGGAIAADGLGMGDEDLLAFLQGDRIDHRLALNALKTGLNDLPFRAVDHHRHARDIRFGRDEVEEPDHRRLGIEHALVHVDVDDLGPGLDLMAGHVERGGVIIGLDQLAELRRAGDVGPLANIDEGNFRGEREGFETGQLEITRFGQGRLHYETMRNGDRVLS